MNILDSIAKMFGTTEGAPKMPKVEMPSATMPNRTPAEQTPAPAEPAPAPKAPAASPVNVPSTNSIFQRLKTQRPVTGA